MSGLLRNGRSRLPWLLACGAALPLVTGGCGSRTADRAADRVNEQVAGERQEERREAASGDVSGTVQQAGLPMTFSFGGRTWQAHDVHWAEAEDVQAARPAAPRAGDEQKLDTERLAGKAADIDDYVPVHGMTVGGMQVYRKKGLDEAFTDNLFLKLTGSGARSGFVEYDATDTWMEGPHLGRVLQATRLPQTLSWNGRKWAVDGVQVYDADVFDDLMPVQGEVSGFQGWQDKEKDDLYLQAELPAGAVIGEKAEEGKERIQGGPIFLHYEPIDDKAGAGDKDIPTP